MTIIAHSKRLIALHDADADEALEVTAICLRMPARASTGSWGQREGTPRAEIAARLAHVSAYYSAPDTTAP